MCKYEVDEIGLACSTNGKLDTFTTIFGQASPGKRSLERPFHRSEDDIKLDLKEILYENIAG
jgi:hypothetical protein